MLPRLFYSSIILITAIIIIKILISFDLYRILPQLFPLCFVNQRIVRESNALCTGVWDQIMRTQSMLTSIWKEMSVDGWPWDSHIIS